VYPYKLLHTIFPTTTMEAKRQVAEEFLGLPSCCRHPEFDEKLAKKFPTVEAILGDECQALLTAWAGHQQLITKAVEFGHRVAGFHARSKGPAKPSDFRMMADNFTLSRVAVAHSTSLGKKGKKRPRIMTHSMVQGVVKRLKQSQQGPRAGVGGNPKMAWMNQRRKELRGQGLSKQDFDVQMRVMCQHYDNDLMIRSSAMDNWKAANVRRRDAEVCEPAASPGSVASHGMWGLGDGMWPVCEPKMDTFLKEHSTHGGIRKLVSTHRAWQANNCVVSSFTSKSSSPASLPGQDFACGQKHPGKCRGRVAEAGLTKVVDQITTGLHGVRSQIKQNVAQQQNQHRGIRRSDNNSDF
jgi:hypothetical protein